MGSREVPLDVSSGTLRVLIDRSDLGEVIKIGAFRLMELCNVRIVEVGEGILVSEYIGRDLKQARDARMPIIQWVPAGNNVALRILVPRDLEIMRIGGLGEPALTELKRGDKVQLVRYGFVKVRKQALSREDVIEAVFMHE